MAKTRRKNIKNGSKSIGDDEPQPGTSAGSSGNLVKHEQDEDESQEEAFFHENEDSIEAPSREESDNDNSGFMESNAMRMNAASALTFGHNRSGVKDATVQTFCEQSDSQRYENVIFKSYLKDKLECPICLRIALPPIMQCRNGHIVCNSCRHKVR